MTSLLFGWIQPVFDLINNGTRTWIIGAFALSGVAIIAAGVVFKTVRFEPGFPATLTGVLGVTAAFGWPLLLIALPFAAVLAGLFYIGYQLAETYEDRT